MSLWDAAGIRLGHEHAFRQRPPIEVTFYHGFHPLSDWMNAGQPDGWIWATAEGYHARGSNAIAALANLMGFMADPWPDDIAKRLPHSYRITRGVANG